MSCTRYQDRLEAYVDGAIPAGADRDDVAAHVSGCEGCTGEVERLRRLDSVLGALRSVEPSPGLEASFARALRAEARAEASAKKPGLLERLFGRWRWTVLATAGAAAAAAILAAVLWPPSVSRGPEPTPRLVAAADRNLVKDLDLVRNLDAVAHMESLRGVTPEEFEAVMDLPELGG